MRTFDRHAHTGDVLRTVTCKGLVCDGLFVDVGAGQLAEECVVVGHVDASVGLYRFCERLDRLDVLTLIAEEVSSL